MNERKPITAVIRNAFGKVQDKLSAAKEHLRLKPGGSNEKLDAAFDHLDLRRLPSVAEQRACASEPQDPVATHPKDPLSYQASPEDELKESLARVQQLESKLSAKMAMVAAQAESLEEKEKLLSRTKKQMKQEVKDHALAKETFEHALQQETFARLAAEKALDLSVSS